MEKALAIITRVIRANMGLSSVSVMFGPKTVSIRLLLPMVRFLFERGSTLLLCKSLEIVLEQDCCGRVQACPSLNPSATSEIRDDQRWLIITTDPQPDQI